MNKKIGILLINLGTPDNCDVKSVRRYLREFLNDQRIINLPFLVRQVLLNFIILPFRPRNSAKAYKKIWTKQGSPLLIHSKMLQAKLAKCFNDDHQVELAMRYGNPSIKNALDNLKDINQLIVLPLYPQYSSAANGSSIEKVYQELKGCLNQPNLKVIRDFFFDPKYLKAQANIIKTNLSIPNAHILFSYHGLPENHLTKSGCQEICHGSCNFEDNKPASCYRKQCYKTTTELVKLLDLKSGQYTTSFQSRLGKTPWIKPYTDETLKELRSKGIKNLAVSCPSFVADCLETLEEIGMAAKEQWLALGGENFQLLPCLNSSPDWVEALESIIRKHL